jgi:hypothetical protein
MMHTGDEVGYGPIVARGSILEEDLFQNEHGHLHSTELRRAIVEAYRSSKQHVLVEPPL